MMGHTVWCSILCHERKGTNCYLETDKGFNLQQHCKSLKCATWTSTKQGKQIVEFYTDNCYAWRNLLQSVYGTGLHVCLDIFHAVKRVSDKIPKRHPLRHECMNEFSMVFRDATNKGIERTKATPEPTTLISQLDKFVKKWKKRRV